MKRNPLHQILNPGSIATAGSGNNVMKMGTMHALSILQDGFKGGFFPIHPKDDTVMGHKAYRSVSDLPEAPDLALLIVPAQQAVNLLDEFGKIGTRGAIIISAGFKETGAEGARLEDRLNEISSRHGIRFLGPNCMGIINSEISLNTTVMPYRLKPGALGLASQSGTYVTQSIPYLIKRGIRFSKAISVGNSTNIDITDALEYLGEDDQTRAISLYIEGIRDVDRFIKVARKITPRKPVLAQYIGGSEAGSRAGLSHTGSMAAPDHLYSGLFKQAGIIRVYSVEDLYNVGNMMALQPRLRGNRIGIVTNSGGPGSAIADTCEAGGLTVPQFSPDLQDKIRPLIPPHAPCGNPVDMTFSMDIGTMSIAIPDMIMKSGEVDGLILHGVMRTGYMKAKYPHIRALLNISAEDMLASLPENFKDIVSHPFVNDMPMAVSSFFDRDDDYTEAYEDNNVPVFDSPEKAALAMTTMLRFHEVQQRKPWKPAALPKPDREASLLIERAVSEGRRSIDEHDSKALLKFYGIPVTDEIVIAHENELSHALEKTGYPAVLKACSPDILHKTEKGLIALDIANRDEAVAAFRGIRERAGAEVPVIAYRMVKGDRELVAGISCHPEFGPSVMFGLGGIFTEALKDIVFRPCPVSAEDAAEMAEEISAKRLLDEFRGMPAVNRTSLSQLIHRLSIIPVIHPEIVEIDCNPVIIEGSEPVVVDALVILA